MVGRKPGSIVLCGHVDTVQCEMEKWQTDPFLAVRERDRIVGLGAADMKGGIAAMLQVFEELTVQEHVPSRSVVLALTADEERAYRGAATLAGTGLLDDAELLIIAEPTADRAYIGQKGELWIRARFRGREAHGSMPDTGANAIIPAARLCVELQEEVKRFPEVLGRGKTSLNIGQLHGGRQINIVPDSAEVSLDLRVAQLKDRDHFIHVVKTLGTSIAQASRTTFALEILNDKAPITSDPSHPMVQAFLRVVQEVHGAVSSPSIVPYSTDAVEIIPRVDIPLIVYGPGDIRQAHQPDEYLKVESLAKAIQVFARVLCSFE
jgi:succinyl-diaminopimelate desuccinylase